MVLKILNGDLNRQGDTFIHQQAGGFPVLTQERVETIISIRMMPPEILNFSITTTIPGIIGQAFGCISGTMVVVDNLLPKWWNYFFSGTASAGFGRRTGQLPRLWNQNDQLSHNPSNLPKTIERTWTLLVKLLGLRQTCSETSRLLHWRWSLYQPNGYLSCSK